MEIMFMTSDRGVSFMESEILTSVSWPWLTALNQSENRLMSALAPRRQFRVVRRRLVT